MTMQKILFLFLLLVIGAGLPPRARADGVGSAQIPGCTSFCLVNNGFAVFGHNYDYAKSRHDGLVFVNKRNVSKSFPGDDSPGKPACWTSRYGGVTFNFIASQTAWAGMNEAGLVIASMRLDEGGRVPEPDARPWILVHYWLQYMLDNFSTVEEVMASDSSLRIVSRGRVPHYLASDRYGHCATIEFIDGRMIAHSGEDLPVKALANSAYDRSIPAWMERSMARKAGKSVPATGASSRSRFIRAAERLAAFRPVEGDAAVGAAFDILKSIGQPSTNWSLVFDAGNLRVHFKTVVHPDVRTVDLRRLDFSCPSPVKMIDVNARLSGDITGRLKDYSFQLHYEHALQAAKKYGLDMKPEDLADHIRRIERFPCLPEPAR